MKKIITLGLVLVMMVTMVACGGNKTEAPKEPEKAETPVENAEKPAENAKSTGKNRLEKIKESGKLVMGTSADYPPYEFHAVIDGKDQIVGFDIEFAKEIAKDLGVELELQDMNFDAVLTGVQSGILDSGIGGINPSPERAETLDFSEIYFTSSYCILVREADKDSFKKEEDLNGKSIGVQLGTVQEEIVKKNLKPGNVVALGKVTDLVMQLKSGMVDAIVLEVPVADSYALNNDDITSIKEINFKDFDIEGGSVVIVGKGEAELAAEINKTIQRLKSEGKFEQWYAEAVKLNDAQSK